MKRITTPLLIILTVCAATACSGPERDNPESVTRAAMKAMQASDAKALCELFTDGDKAGPASSDFVEKCSETFDTIFSARGGSRELDDVGAPLDMTANGDSATARVNEWNEVFTMVRIDGAWYLSSIGD